MRRRQLVLTVLFLAAADTGTAQSTRIDSTWFVTAPDGNSARYRVREQLAGFDFPNDAVGVTAGLTGTLILRSDGKVSPASKFVVDVKPLKSDKERRDGYVQNRLLETAKFPTVDLAITAVGIEKYPLPASGPISFLLHGDLTVRGVTKPTLWRVTGQIANNVVTGTAVTAFTFEEFGIAKPRVASVLSVADTIKLEYDFRMVKK